MSKKSSKNDPRCSFCGRGQSQVEKIIVGDSVHICNECVKLCNDVLVEEKSKTVPWENNEIPKPTDIKNFLDEYVIAQDRAKKILSVAVYNHYKRIQTDVEMDEVEIEKSNVMLVGPTGTGKTELAKTLARVLKVPFSIADATILTEAGYVGEDVENILVGLLQDADYDVERAEKGILYLDEVDKVARKSAAPAVSRDVSGEGVQQALLKILEGTTANIPPKGGRKHPEQPMIQMNTKNILFICGGAFEGIEKLISERIGERTMGFGASSEESHEDNISEKLLSKIQPEDLLTHGMIPEFVGRIPVITTMDSLTEDDLLRILTEPRDAIIKQTKRLFELDGINVEFTDDALRKIVALTVNKGTGARGLRSVLEQSVMDIMYDLPSRDDVDFLEIDVEMIEQGIDKFGREDDQMPRKRA